MAEFAKVATAAEVPPGQAKLVEAGGRRGSPSSTSGALITPSTIRAPTGAVPCPRALSRGRR